MLLFRRGRRIGIECKRADARVLTRSMRIAAADLRLDELRVVYPGTQRYALAKNVEVVPLAELVGAKRGRLRRPASPGSVALTPVRRRRSLAA